MTTVDKTQPKGTKNAWTWQSVPRDWTLTDEVEAALTNHIIAYHEAGAHEIDEHIDKVEVSLENPPGDGRTVTVEATDGVATMTVAISGAADTFGSTTTNNFDWDVSAQDLTIKFTTSAGTAAGRLFIYIHKHEVTIT